MGFLYEKQKFILPQEDLLAAQSTSRGFENMVFNGAFKNSKNQSLINICA